MDQMEDEKQEVKDEGFDLLAARIKELTQEAMAASGEYTFLNPAPTVEQPFSVSINDKYYPTVVFTLSGTVKRFHVINTIKQHLWHYFFTRNHDSCKLKLVFDLKMVNFLNLDAVHEVYGLTVLPDPGGSSALLRHVEKVCFLIPREPRSREENEVKNVLQLAFIGFSTLKEHDKRYKNMRYVIVERNRDVDAFIRS